MAVHQHTAARHPATFSEHAATILATEHWSILGTRAMTWQDASSRVTVYLTTLSASVVALALVADATSFGDAFNAFALVLLPIVIFLGSTTFLRVVQINVQDAYMVAAMNRLRRAYLEIAPELAPYFTTESHDDENALTFTFSFGQPFRPERQFIYTTPVVIASINAAVAAAGAALLADRFDLPAVAVGAIAIATLVAAWMLQYGALLGHARSWRAKYVARFPGEADTSTR